jgi:hypothetical protein
MDNQQLKRLIIRNRGEVAVISLLLLYIKACTLISYGIADGFDCFKMRQHAYTRNLPLIRVSIDSDENITVPYLTFEKARKEYEAKPDGLIAQIKKYSDRIRESRNRLEEMNDNPRGVSHKVKAKITEAIEELKSKFLGIAQQMLQRLHDYLHTINTRRPRIITVDELIEFNCLSLYIARPFKHIPSDVGTQMLQDFLTTSNLAGVEDGIPVVPTEEELYCEPAGFNDIFIMHDEMAKMRTTPQQRGEARWIAPDNSEAAASDAAASDAAALASAAADLARSTAEAAAARLRLKEVQDELDVIANTVTALERQREIVMSSQNPSSLPCGGGLVCDLIFLQAMLDRISEGMELSENDLDQLQHITNAPRAPYLPASMFDVHTGGDSSEEEDLQRAIEASLEADIPVEQATQVEQPRQRPLLSMQLLGQPQFRGMDIEQVRAHMAGARGHKVQ